MAVTGDGMAAVAERHGLSADAVRTLAEALRAGGGAAQWNHPDLGGMGQWSGGGMLQIGDMFNDALKARIRAALEELAASAQHGGLGDHEGAQGARTPGGWWPATLGVPSSTGAQNAMRYARFPDRRRLVVEQDGRIVVYDTGAHRLTAFAQEQGPGQRLTFGGPDGPVTVDDLTIVA